MKSVTAAYVTVSVDAARITSGSKNLFMIFMSFFLGRTIVGERHKRLLPNWVGSDEHKCRPHCKAVLYYPQTVCARNLSNQSSNIELTSLLFRNALAQLHATAVGSASAIVQQSDF